MLILVVYFLLLPLALEKEYSVHTIEKLKTEHSNPTQGVKSFRKCVSKNKITTRFKISIYLYSMLSYIIMSCILGITKFDQNQQTSNFCHGNPCWPMTDANYKDDPSWSSYMYLFLGVKTHEHIIRKKEWAIQKRWWSPLGSLGFGCEQIELKYMHKYQLQKHSQLACNQMKLWRRTSHLE